MFNNPMTDRSRACGVRRFTSRPFGKTVWLVSSAIITIITFVVLGIAAFFVRMLRSLIGNNLGDTSPSKCAQTENTTALRQIERARIVDAALQALGLHAEMATTPSIVRDLLVQLKLQNLRSSVPPFARFLEAAQHSPQPLSTLIRGIRSALIADHPAVVRFLATALANRWLRPAPEVGVALNFAYLLEGFTTAMANNHAVLREVRDCLMAGRRQYGIEPASVLSTFAGVLKHTGSLFAAAKTISIDPAITYYLYVRANGGRPLAKTEVNRLRDEGAISFLEATVFDESPPDPTQGYNRGLRINIYEAAIAEYRGGNTSNALAAYALAEGARLNSATKRWLSGSVRPRYGAASFHDALASSKNHLRIAPLSQAWVSLFETWNMGFVLGNLNDVHLILPKLLIPSVLAAKPQDFLAVRALSLWMTVNLIMFRRFNEVPEVPGPAARRAMATAWGKINAEAALGYAADDLGRAPETTTRAFRKRFAIPEAYIANLVAGYAGLRSSAAARRASTSEQEPAEQEPTAPTEASAAVSTAA